MVEDKEPKGDKVQRMKSNLPFCESGKLHLLKGANWRDMYLGELTTFPFTDYMDLTDVTNMAIDRTESGGVGGNEILDMVSI